MFRFSQRFGREILVKFSASDTQILENIARGKFHQNFMPNLMTPLADKNREKIHSALLQGSCSELQHQVEFSENSLEAVTTGYSELNIGECWSARVSLLSHKPFFSGFFGELMFLWRVELFWICNGFDHSVAFFLQAFHSMWARRRGAI